MIQHVSLITSSIQYISEIYIITFYKIGGYISYSHDVLYIANKSTIFLLNVKHEIEHGEIKRIDMSNIQDNVKRIIPGLTIHGLFNHHIQRTPFFKSHIVIVAMETADNQLDFSQVFNNYIGTPRFTYQFKQ